MPVKLQSDMVIITSNPAASRFNEILRQDCDRMDCECGQGMYYMVYMYVTALKFGEYVGILTLSIYCYFLFPKKKKSSTIYVMLS